ncbi:restriction endonuclease subunit S [Niastella sp. OAS944]|uniref:restriction endonuclease subunit S n=1 Tax=Niastella sp. OAS944 TaxID=2664089 RepID=UPI00347D39B8|nr:type I restriction enzyme S subunit [Chitinophagaceae bacterium OAS944]
MKGYKHTELGWIPEDWGVKKLKEIILLKSGFAFESEFFSNEGPIVLTPGNFNLTGGLYFNEGNIKRYSGNYSDGLILENGSLVIVMTDLTKECNLLGKPAIVNHHESILHNQRIGKVLINSSVSKGFLYNFFLSDFYLKSIKNTATGTTVRHTSNDSILNIYISIPSLSEQNQIENILSTWDKSIETLTQLIAAKQQLKKGLMQQLLTGKKRLPGFNGNWKRIKLGSVFQKIIGGGTPSRDRPEYWNGSIYWATVKDLSNFDASKTQETITELGLKSSASNLIPKGTLITSTRMAVGKSVIFNVDVAINQDLKALIPHEDFDTKFLYYSFQNNFSEIERLGNGSTVKGIVLEDFKNILISVSPNITEQKEIANFFLLIDKEIEGLKTQLEFLKHQKQGLMQQLLTGKKRVKL